MLSAINFPAWDTKLFSFLNGLHVDWLDPIMVAISSVPIWIPLYLVVCFIIIRKFGWQGLVYLVGVILAILVADQFSTIIKYAILRPRPCNALSSVHLLEVCGNGYSFISNHAANVFSFAAITSLIFRKKAFTISIFIWAIVVAYSRIYLGKHYPLDIVGGAVFGMLVAGGCYSILKVYFDLRSYFCLDRLLSIISTKHLPVSQNS